MHTIWSRAAQAHGRPCRACARAASSSTILTTRSVTATRPDRRKVAPSHVFTAFYSAPMATAAVADAATDDRRRNELDGKISDARDKLAILLEQAPAYDPKRTLDEPYVLHNADSTPLGIYEALESICIMPTRLVTESSRRGNRAAFLRSLGKELGLKEQREWWKSPPVLWDKFGDMMAEEEAAGKDVQREPVNAIQFSKQTERINKLVDGLLAETYRGPDGVAYTPDLLESAWNNIRMLRSSGYPKYTHPDLDPAGAAEARRDLSAVTRNIFRDWKAFKEGLLAISLSHRRVDRFSAAKYRKRREYFVGKICHNLLIARFRPDIYNYNTLIHGFKSIGETRFGQVVVDSFLGSRMKATSMTLVALLQHYDQHDIVGFYEIIRRITGDNYRGVVLRSKTVTEVSDHPTLFRWAQNTDAAVAQGFVTERAVVNEVVAEALLDRLISFRMARHAAAVLTACLRERWSISTRYVRRVVALCVAQVDPVAAVELLRGFLRDVEQLSRIIAGTTLSKVSIRKNLHRLLQIGESSADRHLITRSGPAETTSLRRTLDWSSRLSYLRTALWSASVEQQLDSIAFYTNPLSAALASGRLDEEQLESVSANLERMKQRHLEMAAEDRRFQALARIDWITTQCEANQAKALRYEHDLIRTLFKDRRVQMFNIRFSSSIPLEYRLRLLSPVEVAENRLVRSVVSAVMEMGEELETETEHVLYDALPFQERRRLWKLWRRRERVFAVGSLVEHWAQYLHGASRQWKETETETDLSLAGTEVTRPRKQPVPIGEGGFRGQFFESREPLDRAKMAVPAV